MFPFVRGGRLNANRFCKRVEIIWLIAHCKKDVAPSPKGGFKMYMIALAGVKALLYAYSAGSSG